MLPLHEAPLYHRASAYIFEWLFAVTVVWKCRRPSGITYLPMPSRPTGASVSDSCVFSHLSVGLWEKRGCKSVADFQLLSGRVPASSPLSLPAIQKATVTETGLWGPRSVPPAIWQCLIFGQVSAHVECCSNLFQVTQKSRQKIKFHFVKVQVWASPGLVRLHGQTHFLLSHPSNAHSSFLPSSINALAWVSTCRTTERPSLPLSLSTPIQPRTNGGGSASSYQSQDSLNMNKGEQAPSTVSFKSDMLFK